MRADLSVDWPTWSQTAYRSWSIGEAPDELPEVVVEVALRIQRLAERRRPPSAVLAVLPTESPAARRRDPGPVVHHHRAGARRPRGTDEPPAVRWAVEATYEGSIRFDEANLEDPATIEPVVDALTRWVASTLVRLADLPLPFLPPDLPDLPERPDRSEGG